MPVAQANISDKTLAVTAHHFDGTLEYNVHNLYAMYEAKATNEALRAIRNRRPFIFSRSLSYRARTHQYPLSCTLGIRCQWDTQRSQTP